MTKMTASTKKAIADYLKAHKKSDLAAVYFLYLEHHFDVKPTVYLGNRTVYCRESQALELLESAKQLYRETKVQITLDRQNVNENTKRIYICPFSGKVFGDNTHPNPQDAIYDWVSNCPENTELVGGLKSKRFLVSDDPEMIANYITAPQKVIEKNVFASLANGKLYNSRERVISDFKENYLKPITLLEVQNQNRFQMHESLLSFLQEQLSDEKLSSFVEDLSEDDRFADHIQQWTQ